MGLLKRGAHLHLVGIGGIGLSAIARVLNGWGYRVSGSDRELSPLTDALIAEGIAVQKPLRGRQILDAVRMTGGLMLTVHFQEIRHALLDAVSRGFLIEPTAAVCIAGIRKYLHHTDTNEVIVGTITGHGSKTIEKILSVITG